MFIEQVTLEKMDTDNLKNEQERYTETPSLDSHLSICNGFVAASIYSKHNGRFCYNIFSGVGW